MKWILTHVLAVLLPLTVFAQEGLGSTTQSDTKIGQPSIESIEKELNELSAQRQDLVREIDVIDERLKTLTTIRNRLEFEEKRGNGLTVRMARDTPMRETPSVAGDTLARIPEGAEVIAVELKNSYFSVEYNGLHGYVSINWIERTEEVEKFLAGWANSETDSAVVGSNSAVSSDLEGSDSDHYSKSSRSTRSRGTSNGGCCKICKTGKACGNSCISRSKTCDKPPGCACDG